MLVHSLLNAVTEKYGKRPLLSWRGLANAIGIDSAIAYNLLARSWGIVAGPILLLLIVTRLSPVEQGFYYTFSSILGIRALFEFGLGTIVVQYTSHERARLRLSSNGILIGDDIALQRLGSLFSAAIRWHVGIAVIAFVVILPTGVWFFRPNSGVYAQRVDWLGPWILVSLLSSVNMVLTCFYTFIEGLGLVSQVNRIRLYEGMISNIGAWLVLLLGGRLYVSVAAPLVGSLLATGWLIRGNFGILRQIWRNRLGLNQVNWRIEVWPFQWRIGISVMSGYFIFQLINPMLFKFHGPVEAGRMGMTMTFITFASGLAMAWINTKAAFFGQYVARGEWEKLDRIYYRTLIQSLSLLCASYCLMVVGVWALNFFQSPYSVRLVTPSIFIIFAIVQVIHHLSFSQGVYLRAHKIEPFLIPSVVGAGYMLVANLTAGRWFGIVGIAVAYLIGTLAIGLVWGSMIFKKIRRTLHMFDKTDVSPQENTDKVRQPNSAETESTALPL